MERTLANSGKQYYVTEIDAGLAGELTDDVAGDGSGAYNRGGMVRSSDIVLSVVLFTMFFVLGEMLLAHLMIYRPLTRFVIRLAFLLQYSMLIGCLLDYLDNRRGKDE